MGRVVITGMGTVSPLGLTLDSLWKSLSECVSGVRACTQNEKFPINCAAPADAFTGNIDDFGELDSNQKKIIRKGLKLTSREIQMCIAATQRALTDAGIIAGQFDPERVGTSIGSDYIFTTTADLEDAMKSCRGESGHFDFSIWGQRGLPKMTPLWQLKYLSNMSACHIAIYNDFRNVCNSITLREASIGATVGEAVHNIRSGKTDMMVVGTTGSRIHPMKMLHAILTEQVAQGTEPPETVSRPFDRERQGMVLGEGTGSLVLESEEHARKRGAKIYAEIVCGTYVSHLERGMIPNRREALTQAMTLLCRRADMTPEQIGHINAHGLSTFACDIDEANAIRSVFGKRKIPVTAAKSYFGNLGAGSGAVELVAGVLALKNNQLFPILNHVMGDPDCPITPVREFGVPTGDSFIKLSVSPQAQAAAILVRRFE
ncbi:MAG: beta-ketoacyl-[acyl-carrier-protein] synthase family protein [Planctomycetaceae bacterium]|jgi:3-oxoacyl-[acyl-carrier-protein] synthase II|nr:beta-ketoacyl-[acyl-carrier-protein] synthase family protein [Planctomycetaceae bacterium]